MLIQRYKWSQRCSTFSGTWQSLDTSSYSIHQCESFSFEFYIWRFPKTPSAHHLWYLDPTVEKLYITDSWISTVKRHFKDNVMVSRSDKPKPVWFKPVPRLHIRTHACKKLFWTHFAHSVFCCFLLCCIVACFCSFSTFTVKPTQDLKEKKTWLGSLQVKPRHCWFYMVCVVALGLFRDDHTLRIQPWIKQLDYSRGCKVDPKDWTF